MDPSKPLPDNQHERFAKALAKGDLSITASYAKAGFAGDRRNASKEATKYDIPARVAWLKKQSETSQTLTQREKRERLARVVREDQEEVRDILAAIRLDNEMDTEMPSQRMEITVDAAKLEFLARIKTREAE